MAFNTGNAVEPNGSTDPRDLDDNSAILDKLVNGSSLTWPGRLGKILKTWAGLVQQVAEWLAASGWETVFVQYAAGASVQRPTQLIERNGELYRVALQSSLPLTLTGTWATDLPKLVAVGNYPLRRELTDLDDISKGASMLGRSFQWIRNLAKLKTFAGRYEGDIVQLGSKTAMGDRFASPFEWRASSTATPTDIDVVQVGGVATGRWHRVVQLLLLGAGSGIQTDIGSTAVAEVLRMQAMFKAEKIRRAAGVQPWITLGPADPTLVGVTTDPRTTQTPMTITSQANASALAASGTGTATDPYIIRNKNVTFASGSPGLTLNDPAATYYIRFYNVRFTGTSNGSAAINAAAFGTPVTFERCGFAGGSGTADEVAIQLTAITLYFYGCEWSGISGQIFVGAGTTAKRAYLTDCRVIGTAKSSPTNGVFWAAGPGEFDVDILRCAFTSSHFHWHVGNGWTIDYNSVQNTIISGCNVGIGDLNYLKPGGNILSQLPNMIRHSYFKNVRFTFTAGVTQTACYGNGADNCKFENCSFEGSAVDRRLFEWRRTSDVTMLRCYFQKPLGNNTAGNEVCEFWESAGVTIQECWTNGAPEDCYEIVTSYGRNRLIDNVADNVAGQAVDIFGVGSFDVEVDGVYGDCGDAAVLITDVDYVVVSNVFVKQTGTTSLGSVVLERRNAAPGVSPKGCSITGLLSLPEVCSQGAPFAVDTRFASVAGGIGSNFATWWENGELKIYGAATPARLTLR
ncbi:hypothetical protein [Pseudomonas sp. KT_2_4]|uniref:hypothetical protein n=1 Tax=Pseudomonas sp. KT_2_4 TaxID=3241600 RepID=UPI00352A5A77